MPPLRHSPAPRMPAPRTLAVMALAAVVASCASWRGTAPERAAAPVAVDTAESRSPHAVVRYVVSAPEGARTRLDDPLVGGAVDVEVGRAYVSATASQCKRFNTVAAGGERTVRTWAVCRVDGRDWELVTAGAAPLGQQ